MAGPFEFSGINHLALVCRDMERTVAFYSGSSGCPSSRPSSCWSAWASTSSSTAAAATAWRSSGSPTPRAAPGISAPKARPDQGELTSAIGSMNHVAFAVPADKIDEYRTRLIAAGVPCTEVANHDDSEFGLAGRRCTPGCSSGPSTSRTPTASCSSSRRGHDRSRPRTCRWRPRGAATP